MKRYLYIFLSLVIILCGCSSESVNSFDSINTMPSESLAFTEGATQATAESTQPEFENVFDPTDIISRMTDEEIVGQLFLVRCPGSQDAIDDIEQYHLGGFVLFSNDFIEETPQSVSKKIESYQQSSDLPLLIAVDEEGGTVTRISRYSQYRNENFEAPRKLYNKGGMEAIAESETEKCLLLKGLGVNVNLGPVCDITQNESSFIYDRSLGQDPETTALFVETVVDIMHSNQIGCVLKHFPGYGNNVDTHYGIAIDNRDLSVLETVDLIPFYAGIKSNCDSIMISHTYINAIDPQMPASLSKSVTDYLRNKMGFEGVIMTDDLAMDAISKQFGPDESAVLAIEAGVDMLCCTDYPEHYRAVYEALESGRLTREQLEASAARIILWKHELGIL